MSTEMSLRIAMLGASGHVGTAVLRWLLTQPRERVSRVLSLDRRVIDDRSLLNDDRLERHVVDMSTPSALEMEAAPLLQNVDVVVMTMGIGSGIGSVEEFRKVDVELPSAFARAAVAGGVRRAVLLTAAGADIELRRSWLTPHIARGQYFYLKGLVEKNVVEAGFADGVVIFRPGGLLGTGHMPAFIERVMQASDWLWPLNFRCIQAENLAAAISTATIEAKAESAAPLVLEGQALHDLLPVARTLVPTRALED